MLTRNGKLSIIESDEGVTTPHIITTPHTDSNDEISNDEISNETTTQECSEGDTEMLSNWETSQMKMWEENRTLNDDVVFDDETTTQTESVVTETTTRESSIENEITIREISEQMFTLRIEGDSWKVCRAKLALSNNEFHKGIRLTSVYRETMIDLLNEKLASGWNTKRSLSNLTGVDGIEDLLNNDVVIEAPVAKTTTQTESEPVVKTTKQTTSIDDKLSALLSSFGK